MQPFTTIHYDGTSPVFKSFATVQAAEAYLRELIVSRQVSSSDSLAIISNTDDRVVYFKQHNNTVASLYAGLHRRTPSFAQHWQQFLQSVQERLTIAFSALTDVVGRR